MSPDLRTLCPSALIRTGHESGNENRERILELLRRQGSETAPGLGRRLGLARATVNHHLRVLQRSGAVRRSSTASGKGVAALFVATDPAPAECRPFAHPRLAGLIGASGSRKAIVQVLLSSPGASLAEVAERLRRDGRPLSRPTVHHHLALLVGVGLVDRVEVPGGVRFLWRAAAWRRSDALASPAAGPGPHPGAPWGHSGVPAL
jgi:predicted ArsR family transcriptional regulator